MSRGLSPMQFLLRERERIFLFLGRIVDNIYAPLLPM